MEPTAAARSKAINEVLSHDVLADVLGRLPPRSLAAARCVCTDWRANIDDRRLLRTDLLPLSLSGIFINFEKLRFPEFFSRPSTSTTSTATSGKLDFLPFDEDYYLMDHCNGLLLINNDVVNPATRQWTSLPPPLSYDYTSWGKEYIAFDPTISPHYEVIVVPYFPRLSELDPIMRELEWPPSTMIMKVFSSVTKRWEERPFVREGQAAGIIRDLGQLCQDGQCRAVYWRRALYVHDYFHVIRLSLSDGKYQVIKTPPCTNTDRFHQIFYLGKSKKGVYLASFVCDCICTLSVWILKESHSKAKWILKHQNGLKPLLPRWDYSEQVYGPWILRDVNYDLYCKKFGGPWYYRAKNEDLPLEDNNEAQMEDKFEWYSDNDDAVETQGYVEKRRHVEISILGFHPYKEIVFLGVFYQRGLAYHLNSSKLQDLGYLYPKNYVQLLDRNDGYIHHSFPYTPCWIRDI